MVIGANGFKQFGSMDLFGPNQAVWERLASPLFSIRICFAFFKNSYSISLKLVFLTFGSKRRSGIIAYASALISGFAKD